MSDKDAAKRRRQARNRQERQSRQKRTEAAKRGETARPAGDEGRGGRPSRTPTGAPARGGLLGRLFPPRPQPAASARSRDDGAGEDGPDGDESTDAATEDAATEGTGGRAARRAPARRGQPPQSVVHPIEDAPGFRGWLLARLAQPGGRPTIFSFLLSLVFGLMLLAFPIFPRFAFDGYGEMVVRAQPGLTGDALEQRLDAFADVGRVDAGVSRLADVVGPLVTGVFAVVPLLITAMAVSSLVKPTRSRTLLMSTIAAFAYAFLSQGIGTLFLPGVAVLAWGLFQSRRADRDAAAAAG